MLAVAGMLSFSILPLSAMGAAIDDGYVVRFNATPNFINLNRESLVEVEISDLHDPVGDSYLATVTAPDDTESSVWFNFTSVGVMNNTLGDPSSGFMTAVDQVGTYDLRLDYYDGSNYTLAGVEQVDVTDQLDVVLEIRIASNEYTDAHNCPVANDFQRGAEFVGIAFVYYASTGEAVTPDVPTTKDNITGTILDETKVLPWRSYASNWHHVWFFPWDAPVGPAEFSAEASDGLGNTGSAVTGMAWNSAVTIIPAVLSVTAQILADNGSEAIVFEPGETLTIEVEGRYEDHNAHNQDFAGLLKPDRDGEVRTHLGWGAFNATSSMFEHPLTNLTLSYDTETKVWVTTYEIPADSANISNIQALVLASDGAGDPPNSGMVFTTMFSIQAPPPDPPEPPEPPEPEEVDEGFSGIVVGGLSAVALVLGLGIGMVVSRKPKETKKLED